MQLFFFKPYTVEAFTDFNIVAWLQHTQMKHLNWNNLFKNMSHCFVHFKTGTYTITTSLSLGKLLLVKVEKDPYFVLPEDEWYCSKIVVTTPEGDAILFPCHRWISRGELVELRGGRGLLQMLQIMIYRSLLLRYLDIT